VEPLLTAALHDPEVLSFQELRIEATVL